jgi:hypothetical protein
LYFLSDDAAENKKRLKPSRPQAVASALAAL